MTLAYGYPLCHYCERRADSFDSFQDVTEIIGSGKVDLGFKAMIHTLAVGSSVAAYTCARHHFISEQFAYLVVFTTRPRLATSRSFPLAAC